MAGHPVWPGIFPGARLSHVHMTLREFVKRKIITDVTIADAAKSKLQGGDPIAEYLGDCIDDDGITLDDNTRVIAWFDN